jgi:23S rRNA (adenine-N6)-dimethyltransferase
VPGGQPPRQPRRWGFHRLTDAWAHRLVADANIRPGDLVLDIGAGTGALTAPLAAAGAQVLAIELDPGRRRALEARFAGPAVRVVTADAAELRLPRRPFRVVANPPFAVSTAVLKRLLGPGSRLVAADLVLPVPVAVRWASGRGPGAGRWLRDFDLAVGRRVPATAFRPHARSGCAVLVIRRRPGARAG